MWEHGEFKKTIRDAPFGWFTNKASEQEFYSIDSLTQ